MEKDQILDLEQQRVQAILEKDFDAFIQLSHPDLRYIHSSGVTDTRESYVESCRAGQYEYQQIQLPVDEVLVAGDTAVVLGQMKASLSVNGSPKELDYHSIAVWTRVDGQWKFLAFTPRSVG